MTQSSVNKTKKIGMFVLYAKGNIIGYRLCLVVLKSRP